VGNVNKETRLRKVCKNCWFRRFLPSRGNAFYRGQSRLDSFCAHLMLTGETRDCMPTDTECEKFRPRGERRGRR
jgi:hypothetical protein